MAGATEALRRLGSGRGLALVGGMLLLDGVYLAWVMYSTGGTQSPLRFLVYIHVIAVTLLASYRTGLKITAWHTLLYFCVFYAQAAELLTPTESVPGALPGTGSLFNRLSIFNVAAIWLVALGTMAFSAVNERELRRRKHDLEALAEMASQLENAPAPTAVTELLLETVTSTFGFSRGVVLASHDGDPEVMAYKGPNPAVESIPGVDPIVQESWTSRKTLLVAQLDGDSNRRLALLLPFARNLVVVPMIAEGAAVGALVVEHSGSNKIERSVVGMLEQLAAHAALALKNAWLLQQVQRMAETDALTGIANRRSFEEALERELSRATRNGEQVTLMMLDVDHFKKFNDNYGHQAGDDVLRSVANALADRCRDFDVPARYGGEEFAVVAPVVHCERVPRRHRADPQGHLCRGCRRPDHRQRGDRDLPRARRRYDGSHKGRRRGPLRVQTSRTRPSDPFPEGCCQ